MAWELTLIINMDPGANTDEEIRQESGLMELDELGTKFLLLESNFWNGFGDLFDEEMLLDPLKPRPKVKQPKGFGLHQLIP